MAMRKPVVTTKLPGVMKESGEGCGVVYFDKPEGALRRGIFGLIEGGVVEEYGPAAWRFVEEYGWDDVVDEFEGIVEGAWMITGGARDWENPFGDGMAGKRIVNILEDHR